MISFVEKYYKLDFKGAAEMLAKEYGISLEGAFRKDSNKDEYFEINRQAARFFYKTLRRGSNEAYIYMKNREISEETLNKFGVGYADGEWQSLTSFLKTKNISEQKAYDIGLISQGKKNYYDRFRDRVIFPIINTKGNVIGFGGRIIVPGEPKYLNSQESNVFQKKDNLYGLNLAKDEVNKTDNIILVEGYMDVIALYQAGIKNIVASLGTALTSNQAKLIKRYTKNVILSYDADDAGKQAAYRGSDILYNEGLNVKVVLIDGYKDPDEYIKHNGRAAFLDLVETALPYADFKIYIIKEKYNLDKEEERVEFIQEAVSVFQNMKPIEADIYIKKLSEEYGISEGAIRREYAGIRENMPKRAYKSYEDNNTNKEISSIEKNILSLMLADKKFINDNDGVYDEIFISEMGQSLYKAIINLYKDSDLRLSPEEIQEELTPEEYTVLNKLDMFLITEGKAEKIYNQCINKIELDKLKKDEIGIVARLEIAEEEKNEEEVKSLTLELIDVQKRIREMRGNY